MHQIMVCNPKNTEVLIQFDKGQQEILSYTNKAVALHRRQREQSH